MIRTSIDGKRHANHGPVSRFKPSFSTELAVAVVWSWSGHAFGHQPVFGSSSGWRWFRLAVNNGSEATPNEHRAAFWPWWHTDTQRDKNAL
jgi:hypothetical protein